MIRPALMIVVTSLVAFPALAQDGGRYVMDKSENGYVRLDTQTGEMSTCSEVAGEIVCRTTDDERLTLESRIKALEDRIATLEKKLEGGNLPSEQEFEQTMGFMESFFRRFMGIIKEFEGEQQPQPPKSST